MNKVGGVNTCWLCSGRLSNMRSTAHRKAWWHQCLNIKAVLIYNCLHGPVNWHSRDNGYKHFYISYFLLCQLKRNLIKMIKTESSWSQHSFSITLIWECNIYSAKQHFLVIYSAKTLFSNQKLMSAYRIDQ